MAGGILQLVATGDQDTHLTGTPQVTLFKQYYRRYTNFALEHIEQTILGVVAFGSKFSFTLKRSGDLVQRVMLELTLPPLDVTDGKLSVQADDAGYYASGWVNWIGHRVVEETYLEIGGQRIDTLDSNFRWAWDQLVEPDLEGYKTMVGADGASLNAGGTICIPLKFFFSHAPAMALPLVALQYHDVTIHVKLRAFKELIHGHGRRIQVQAANPDLALSERYEDGTIRCLTKPRCQVFADYVFLDKMERRKFAQYSHEYLVTVTQSSGGDDFEGCEYRIPLAFKHPCTELIWVIKKRKTARNWDWYEFRKCKTATLYFNNVPRFCTRRGEFFTLQQPWQYHSHIPVNHNVHVYSFCLEPEESQPTGSCNMSRIDNVGLVLKMEGSDGYSAFVYARSYNILRVKHGMAGLAYSS